MRKSEEAVREQKLQRFQAAAREAGFKLTHQRLEIFRELARTQQHPDAESIFRAVQRRMPTVSLDTVYRTLWTLHDLGLLTTLGPPQSGVRFDTNLEHHHHYVCVRCGLVRDFDSPALNELQVPEAVQDLGSVVNAHVEVRGLCVSCQREATNATTTNAEPRVSKMSNNKRTVTPRRKS